MVSTNTQQTCLHIQNRATNQLAVQLKPLPLPHPLKTFTQRKMKENTKIWYFNTNKELIINDYYRQGMLYSQSIMQEHRQDCSLLLLLLLQ